MTEKEITAYRLKHARLYNQMTCFDIAIQLDVSQTLIQHWEQRGISKPKYFISELSKILGLPESYFTEEPSYLFKIPYLSIWVYKGLITLEKAIELENDVLLQKQ